MFLPKKLHVLPKLMLLKVDQYQQNRWTLQSMFMIVTSIISKHWEENFVVYVHKKTGIMLWFDDWNKTWWECTYFCCNLYPNTSKHEFSVIFLMWALTSSDASTSEVSIFSPVPQLLVLLNTRWFGGLCECPLPLAHTVTSLPAFNTYLAVNLYDFSSPSSICCFRCQPPKGWSC